MASPPKTAVRPDHPAPLLGFHEPVRRWFAESFAAPTAAQTRAWPALLGGHSTLILAPTGSGKTLAAFLCAIDRLMFAPPPERTARCRVLYISPLKALAVDVERNLRAPLKGVARLAQHLDHAYHMPEIAVRTGDTPQRERVEFARRPADILITTPESIYLLLTTAARATLSSVEVVILDEIHALLPTKRGAHLMLSLERLERLRERPLQRIGLSATVHPIEEAARFLGGFAPQPPAAPPAAPPAPTPRPVTIADARAPRAFDLRVEVPVEDMAALGQIEDLPSGPASLGERRKSVWPSLHELLLAQVLAHRSTLIFVNSRRLAERLAAAVNELHGAEIVRAHHGSMAREQRTAIEDQLKAGLLPALVATSSLELGIDMGSIDLVVQIEAPPSIAAAIQRIGRAGHQIDTPSKGVILPKFRGDLLACAALAEAIVHGRVEPQRYLRNPLDVLSQHIVAAVAMDEWRVDDLLQLVRQAAPFAELSKEALEGVLDLLSGRYPSDDFAELSPRLNWDRVGGLLRPRPGAQRVAVTSGGTIPDRGLYGVFLAGAASQGRTSARVGELDEEMVFESRVGETFVLGASTWRIEEITHDRVLVSPAPGEPGKMPFWRGDRAGRSLDFGRAIGALCRTLRQLPREQALRRLTEQHALTAGAAENLLRYLDEQDAACGVVPDDRTLVLERYRDEIGDQRVCLLSPLGGKVLGPWALALGAMWRRSTGGELDVLWTDDGIVARFPDTSHAPPLEALLPDPDEVQELVATALGGSALFAGRFREAAARALLLTRKAPGNVKRTALWQQRRRAADLLQAASRFPSFPIVLEAYRECLADVFDMPALKQVLRDVRGRKARVVTVDSERPSPFAMSLLWNYAANFIYEGDAPLSERRAQALLVDPARLRDLLGEVDWRELLDPDAALALELDRQHLSPERRARHADAVHDLLRRLGALDADEIAARCDPPAAAAGWIGQLVSERRAVRSHLAGAPRYVAVEDVARYRDALGVPPPPGLPAALLQPVPDALAELLLRHARTHGPFRVADVAARLGLSLAAAEAALLPLLRAGRLVQGAFLPGSGPDLCDAEVLRLLRQRALSKLRKEIEPVEGPALGRLYLSWQHVEAGLRGPAAHSGAGRLSEEALLEVVEVLEGAPIPASVLDEQVLAARLVRYESWDLDRLTGSGAVVWVGLEPLGESDGKIGLYLSEHLPLLWQPPVDPPDREVHRKLRAHLRERGASFFPQLAQACGGFSADVERGLWDLVWAGEVTCDSLQPLRAYVRGVRGGDGHGRRERGRFGRPFGRGLGGVGRGGAAPHVQGRWALLQHLVGEAPTPTERLTAQAQVLLRRYGVLTREAVQAEGVVGGFSALYPVLKAMEEAGQIRRGYFVAGRGATQFALPEAVERLRQLRRPPEEAHAVVLAATDPANPYGAALPWPGARREDAPEGAEGAQGSTTAEGAQGATAAEGATADGAGGRPGRRPGRAAGAVVVLVDGALAAWMGRNEEALHTFLGGAAGEEARPREETEAALAQALGELVGIGRRRALLIREVDGQPARDSGLVGALQQAGFQSGAAGFLRRL